MYKARVRSRVLFTQLRLSHQSLAREAEVAATYVLSPISTSHI